MRPSAPGSQQSSTLSGSDGIAAQMAIKVILNDGADHMSSRSRHLSTHRQPIRDLPYRSLPSVSGHETAPPTYCNLPSPTQLNTAGCEPIYQTPVSRRLNAPRLRYVSLSRYLDRHNRSPAQRLEGWKGAWLHVKLRSASGHCTRLL